MDADDGIIIDDDHLQTGKKDGYELSARFSYITNAKSYCGPSDSPKLLYDYLVGNNRSLEAQDKIRASTKKFEALYPYLQLIAEKSNKDFMDYEVLEAYWIGNSLLELFTRDDMISLVEMLVKRGLPRSLAEGLIEQMPHGAIPHHAFHVMYIGVGNVTGHVETTLQNMDSCRPSSGRVIEIIDAMHLLVETDTLVEREGVLMLEDDEKIVIYDPKILPNICVGDYIAIHWGFAGKRLTGSELDALRKYTKISVDVRNSISQRS